MSRPLVRLIRRSQRLAVMNVCSRPRFITTDTPSTQTPPATPSASSSQRSLPPPPPVAPSDTSRRAERRLIGRNGLRWLIAGGVAVLVFDMAMSASTRRYRHFDPDRDDLFAHRTDEQRQVNSLRPALHDMKSIISQNTAALTDLVKRIENVERTVNDTADAAARLFVTERPTTTTISTSSPPSSAPLSNTVASTLSDISDVEDADADDIDVHHDTVDAVPRSRTYKSSPRFHHPDRPNIHTVVGTTLPTILTNRKENVLVEVYSPDCGACLMITPVLDEIAHVMDKVNAPVPVRVYVFDRSRNHVNGFLTDEEERYSPLIKLYPTTAQSTSETSDNNPLATSVTYDGPPNAAAIIKWLHSAIDDASKFDLNAALDIVKANERQTQEKIDAAYEQRMHNEMSAHPSNYVLDRAPCNESMHSLMKLSLTKGYESGLDQSLQDERNKEMNAKLAIYGKCIQNKANDITEYWQDVLRIAQSQLKTKNGDDDQTDDDNIFDEEAAAHHLHHHGDTPSSSSSSADQSAGGHRYEELGKADTPIMTTSSSTKDVHTKSRSRKESKHVDDELEKELEAAAVTSV